MAKSDIIWIAEDDDYSDTRFLEQMLPLFDDPEIALAYSQSYAVDETDKVQFSYMDYYKHEFEHYQRWQTTYKNGGREEVSLGLGLINTIPNASAVLFKRFDTQVWQSKWGSSALAGDWAFYLHALQHGKVAFNNEHLNYHRRHQQTMTEKTRNADSRFKEVAKIHKDVLALYDVNQATKALMRAKMKEVWIDVSKSNSQEKFDIEYDQIINE